LRECACCSCEECCGEQRLSRRNMFQRVEHLGEFLPCRQRR
jgi:hypothetical protein